MLKLLADETRFQIVTLLLKHDFCVGALARQLGISEAAVSQHIRILRKGGLLKGEKRGYWTHYAVDREMLELIAEQFRKLAKLSADKQDGCLRDESGQADGRRSAQCKCSCGPAKKLTDLAGKCGRKQRRTYRGGQDAPLCREKEDE